MTQRLIIHPKNPQLRLIHHTVKTIQEGGIVVYPTDSAYAIGCHLGDKAAAERIREIRQLDEKHHFTLVCNDLSQLAVYAKVDNPTFRLLKAYTPGPYTFILEATKEVPRRLVQQKRKTIGLRVPNHQIVQDILKELGEPLMSVTLILPGMSEPLADIENIAEKLAGKVDLIVDGGPCSLEPTSVIDLTGGEIKIIRQGKGDTAPFK